MLDLRDVAFISGATSATWTQSGTSGTLAITNGAVTADISLLGQYSTANFHVTSGIAGGTIVTDPPVLAQPNTLVNPQHA
jgi:hypothetical protein